MENEKRCLVQNENTKVSKRKIIKSSKVRQNNKESLTNKMEKKFMFWETKERTSSPRHHKLHGTPPSRVISAIEGTRHILTNFITIMHDFLHFIFFGPFYHFSALFSVCLTK